ncbi:MAG: response regulator receiver protein [Candidatus Saccharibacteria bacterium]|nr:response regulator receiver protein [Candidatus Saccharibacteria bacterium]
MEPTQNPVPPPTPAAVPEPTPAAADAPAPAAPTGTQLGAAPVAQPQTATPTGRGAGRKILCIEDEHFIAELYSRSLTKAGYDVTVEMDGIQGLALAQTNQFDIILLDLMVPNKTGIEILRALRDKIETPELKAKIIITTNLEQREDVRADIEKQADGYLVKAELTPRELAAFVDSIA